MTARLWTFRQAAAHLGVPEASLTRAAEQYGYVISMGRARRIAPEDLEALVTKCRASPKVPGSTGGNDPGGPERGSSATARTRNRPALKIAERLKRGSPATSFGAGGAEEPPRQAT